jgi:DNA-binding NtrC family response regulator
MSELQILIVDDDEPLRGAIRAYLETKGYLVREAGTGKACLQALEASLPDAVLMDYELPDSNATQLLREVLAIDSSMPVIVITGYGTIDLAVRVIKDGAEQFLTKPVELLVLSKLLEGVLENRRQKRKQLAGQANSVRYKRNPFLGTSAVMSRLEEAVGRVLNSHRTILIEGETGTGKGVLASWMHENGPRADEPFVDLNCAGLNRELLESELFGYEKGAFTGAVAAKPGIMEVAHRGTIFLDEIGDMDPLIQPKLLKVLEEKQIRRIGAVRNRIIDVQLIAATNRDLASLVAEGKFRSDLYFRVNTIQLRIPPLRERVEDIPVLADWFLRHLKIDLNRDNLNLADGVKQALQSYSWPGNIREFRNVLERAALLCDGGVVRVRDLNFQLIASPSTQPGVEPGGDLTIEELERRHIALVLQRVNGKVDKAAGKLGIPRSTLYSKIKQYHITLTT